MPESPSSATPSRSRGSIPNSSRSTCSPARVARTSSASSLAGAARRRPGSNPRGKRPQRVHAKCGHVLLRHERRPLPSHSPKTIGKDYETNMREVLTKARAIGVANIVAGTPGAVDTKYFRRPGTTPAQYNDSLARLGEDRPQAGRRASHRLRERSQGNGGRDVQGEGGARVPTTMSAAETACIPRPTVNCSWPPRFSRASASTATSARSSWT